MAVPSAMSCFMGITEPAIFGVNLRFFKPFICGAVGGACGALYASIVGLGATGTGVTGIFGLLLCLHDPLNYIIMFLISYENIEELNRRAMMALVDRIIVYENHVVEIEYKYRDEYEQATQYVSMYREDMAKAV